MQNVISHTHTYSYIKQSLYRTFIASLTYDILSEKNLGYSVSELTLHKQ